MAPKSQMPASSCRAEPCRCDPCSMLLCSDRLRAATCCWRRLAASATVQRLVLQFAANISYRFASQQVEQDPDVCSICLDEFTEEDPDNSTQCG